LGGALQHSGAPRPGEADISDELRRADANLRGPDGLAHVDLARRHSALCPHLLQTYLLLLDQPADACPGLIPCCRPGSDASSKRPDRRRTGPDGKAREGAAGRAPGDFLQILALQGTETSLERAELACLADCPRGNPAHGTGPGGLWDRAEDGTTQWQSPGSGKFCTHLGDIGREFGDTLVKRTQSRQHALAEGLPDAGSLLGLLGSEHPDVVAAPTRIRDKG
jgi:hypothetical protein